MRFQLLALSGLTCALLGVTPKATHASEITFPAVAGGDLAFDRVFGEVLTFIPDRQVDQFSFWLGDPGDPTGLQYRMGIAATDAGFATSILFETDVRTLESTDAGAAHRVTAATGGLMLDPSTLYFFFVLPIEPLDALWTIETTLTNFGPGGRGGKVGLTQWNEDPFHPDISETPDDRDLHFSATFSDPVPVPEPGVLILMGLGAVLVNAKRLRRTESASATDEPSAAASVSS
jgi:PEP-CTERM motif